MPPWSLVTTRRVEIDASKCREAGVNPRSDADCRLGNDGLQDGADLGLQRPSMPGGSDS